MWLILISNLLPALGHLLTTCGVAGSNTALSPIKAVTGSTGTLFT